jgi:hypothetical protein
MESLDHDYKIYTTPRAGDETLHVKFFIDAVEDVKASKAAGRPIFKDVEWIDIRTPASRDAVIRPCRPDDYERFPQHYDLFKRRVGTNDEQLVGTPLSTWPWHGMTRSRVEELKHFNIRTVEQLAGTPDGLGQKLLGFQAMKQAAQAYLESVKTTAPVARLQAQLEQAIGKLAEQGLEIARLQARAHGLPEPKSTDVVIPMREQIEREMQAVKIEVEETDMAKSKKRKTPPPRRP